MNSSASALQWVGAARHNFETLMASRRSVEARLYGIVDSAADESLYALLMDEPACSQVRCLFDGTPAVRYRATAPYLIELNVQSPLTQIWMARGWTQHWGIWLETASPLEQVKTHLKKFLFVRKADKRKAFFRFYDPRVLDQVMPLFTPAQRGAFFGLNHRALPDAFYTSRTSEGTSSLRRYVPKRSLAMRLQKESDYEMTPQDWHHEAT